MKDRKKCQEKNAVNVPEEILKHGKKFQMYINNLELNHFNIAVIMSCSYSSFPLLLLRKPKGNP